jgi:RNA polymerase sigma-70 factor (ECF subfamily)
MTLSEETDEQLMSRYVSGENEAFQEIFRRHAPALLGMMRRHVRGSEEANDLVQQTFLHLHRARNDFRQGALLKPWLFTIGMNCLREQFRRKTRKKESPLEEEIEAKLVAEYETLEDRQEAKLRQERVRAALLVLPDNQREVIEMHWFQGRPFEEIAKMLGASLSAVKVRAHRGYTRLRAALAEAEKEP